MAGRLPVPRLPVLVASLALALGACGRGEGTIHLSNHGSLSIRDGAVAIDGPGGEARVSPAGDLTIAGQPVTVDDAQRHSLAAFYAASQSFIEQAKSVGKAGADVGAAAASSVVGGLVKGDMSEVKSKVEAKAEVVKAAAAELCTGLETLRGAQEAVAAGLPAFRPYVTITADDSRRCAEDLHKTPAASTPN
ncbi:MAG: hypothetical protein JSR73_10780 [Proteobacteria bacterium]|nr:hypothetical protein [Pseudomonadota bacterium]